jgi:hypothetical protein
MPVTNAQKQRVIDLCNAIANLRRGDLRAVLELDGYAPLEEFGPDDRCCMEIRSSSHVVSAGRQSR